MKYVLLPFLYSASDKEPLLAWNVDTIHAIWGPFTDMN